MSTAKHLEPGIYVLRRINDRTPLYVGTTSNLTKRLRSNARESGILPGRLGQAELTERATDDVEVLTIPLPCAVPALLSVIGWR